MGHAHGASGCARPDRTRRRDSFGDRLVVPEGVDRAIDRRWLGQKSGKGCYVYPKSRSTSPSVNEELLTLIRGDAKGARMETSTEDIPWRLVLPMVNETARLLDESVTDSTETVDLATVLGTGLAPFRGGLASFADAVGLDEVIRRLEELRERHGDRFTPAPPLVKAARSHGPLGDVASHRANITASLPTDAANPNPS